MANFRAYLRCRRCGAVHSLMSASGDAVYEIGARRVATLDKWLEQHTGYAPDHEDREDDRPFPREDELGAEWLELVYE